MRDTPRLLRLTVLISCCSALFPFPGAAADHIVQTMDESGHRIYINAADSSSASAKLDPGSSSRSLPFMVREAAARHHIDPALVHAIVRVESGYDSHALSNKGAMGLMQLIPATARRFGVKHPYDARENLEGGTTYLRYLLDRFNGNLPLSLAAYNAGENSVLRHGGIPPYAETQAYVRKITSIYSPVAPQAVNGGGTEITEKPPIYQYVDASGVLHFSSDGE